MRFALAGLVALTLLASAPANAAQDLLGATVVDSYVKPKGAFINIVSPGGSIAMAGLLGGDVITSADGKAVDSAAALQALIGKHRAGDKLKIAAVHLGKPGHFTLTLVAAGSSAPASAPPLPPSSAVATKMTGAGKPMAQTASAAPKQMTGAMAPARRALPAANVRWTTYRDPSEGAFTIEVPAGWRVSGGSKRFSQVEVRLGVEATSPDSKITLFYGDTSIPIFSAPNRMLAMGGLRVGSTYDMGMGVRTLIEPYATGANFAAAWGRSRVARECSQVSLLGHRGRPDSSQGIDRVYASAGIQRSVQAGEASFHCNLGGADAGGYVFASTELVQSQMGAIWDVNAVLGTVAPTPRAAEAYALLSHMAASFTIDRGWMSRERELSAQFDRIVAQTNAIVSQRIIDNGKAAAAMSDMMFKGGQDRANATFNAEEKYDAFAVRGTSDYVSDSGTLYPNVDNSHSHVYVNYSTGQVLPTDSENLPGPGFTEVHQVPPGQ
jgi:hypothetical protein